MAFRSCLRAFSAFAASLGVAGGALALECRSIDDWANPLQVGKPAANEAKPGPGLQSMPQGQVQMLQRARSRLAAVAQISPYVVVCEFDRIGAIALPPGANIPQPGVVMFTSGILQLFGQDENRAASVLAHEMAHLIEDHGRQSVQFARLAAQRAVQVGAASEAQRAGSGVLARNQAFLTATRAYSRDLERRADEVGYQMYQAAGYDPRQATAMFEAMRALQGDRAKTYLDSHPGWDERMSNVLALARDDVARVQAVENAKKTAGESERYQRIAEEHIAQGRWRELARLVDQWLAVLPESGLGWYYRGLLAERTAPGRLASWETFARAAQLDPERPQIWDALIAALLRAGFKREAVACLSVMATFHLPTSEIRARLFDDRVIVHGAERSVPDTLRWGRGPQGQRVISNDPTIFINRGIEPASIPPTWIPVQ